MTKIIFEVKKPKSGTYADDNEDRLKGNIYHFFNNYRIRLMIEKLNIMEQKKDRFQTALLNYVDNDIALINDMLTNMKVEINDK